MPYLYILQLSDGVCVEDDRRLCIVLTYADSISLFLEMLFQCLSCWMIMIPVYLVLFKGSIESVRLQWILLVSSFAAFASSYCTLLPAPVGPFFANGIPIFNLGAVLVMLWGSIITWYTLKKQQFDREDNLSRRTFLATSVKHKASTLMMRLSGTMGGLMFFNFTTQFIYILCLYVEYGFKSQVRISSYPSSLRMTWFVYEIITACKGVLLAFAFYYSSIFNEIPTPSQEQNMIPLQIIGKQLYKKELEAALQDTILTTKTSRTEETRDDSSTIRDYPESGLNFVEPNSPGIVHSTRLVPFELNSSLNRHSNK
ncbi:hypothetical protein HDV02_005357 [Globomyces sp. JEL0801]|nr:hypothetical protein HDV02_005357 [Globomyces sp. JEL0801]